jgi:hypothetical protein
MIPEFALRLILGLVATWCLLPRVQITSGYFRIQMLLTMGLAVLATLTAGQWKSTDATEVVPDGLTALLVGIGVTSFIGSILWTLERRAGGQLTAVLMLLQVVGAMLLVVRLRETGGANLAVWIADLVTSGWVIGGLTGAMLLGHWYLTATGMRLEPLERATRLAQIALTVRLLFIVGTTFTATAAARESLLGDHLVWTILRWTAGIVGPLTLALMTPGTLKYRNTQSATGVLFAAVILVFIGEAAGMLLSRELEWPL